jgi:hypothetical protein
MICNNSDNGSLRRVCIPETQWCVDDLGGELNMKREIAVIARVKLKQTISARLRRWTVPWGGCEQHLQEFPEVVPVSCPL